MANLLASDSTVAVRISRPSRARLQVFGYTLRSNWIIDFGQKHNVDPLGVKDRFALIVDSVELIRDELKKEGEYALVRYLSSGPPDMVAQIYVARNFRPSMTGSTTVRLILEKAEKLKKFLDTPEDPEWMNLS